MKNKLKISPLLFVATALCFLLPFLTISSGGSKLGSFSGVRVATGISVNAPNASESSQQNKFAADPMAVFAVLSILIGFAMSFVATGRLAIYPAITGVIGTAAMVGARASFANQVAKQTGGALHVNMQPDEGFERVSTGNPGRLSRRDGHLTDGRALLSGR